MKQIATVQLACIVVLAGSNVVSQITISKYSTMVDELLGLNDTLLVLNDEANDALTVCLAPPHTTAQLWSAAPLAGAPLSGFPGWNETLAPVTCADLGLPCPDQGVLSDLGLVTHYGLESEQAILDAIWSQDVVNIGAISGATIVTDFIDTTVTAIP
jgi:hypothetical protein